MPKTETDWSIFEIVKTPKEEENAETEQQASAPPKATHHKIARSIVPGSAEHAAARVPPMTDYSIFQVAGATKVSSDMSHDVIHHYFFFVYFILFMFSFNFFDIERSNCHNT